MAKSESGVTPMPAESRLAQALNKWMEYYGWTPFHAAKECKLHWNTFSRMLNETDYRPTDAVRKKLTAGFKLKEFEEIWKDPLEVKESRANQEHAPPAPPGNPIDNLYNEHPKLMGIP